LGYIDCRGASDSRPDFQRDSDCHQHGDADDIADAYGIRHPNCKRVGNTNHVGNSDCDRYSHRYFEHNSNRDDDCDCNSDVQWDCDGNFDANGDRHCHGFSDPDRQPHSDHYDVADGHGIRHPNCKRVGNTNHVGNSDCDRYSHRYFEPNSNRDDDRDCNSDVQWDCDGNFDANGDCHGFSNSDR
jgi:hypothetical protein